MPSFALNTDECYCAICDLYFSSLEQRAEHIQASSQHPECDYCQRRFLNKNILRNHFIYSRHHHYCASCEIGFQTPAGLRYHIEHAPVHCDDSDDEGDGDYVHNENSIEWEEEMGLRMYPDEPESSSEDSDDSWEAYDDYDYEDAEELNPQEESEDDEEDTKNPNSIACAPCGHIFCSPCITHALKYTSACPICSEAGTVEQLRKIFLV
ncbi:RING-type domain-containing protein [Mycena venus]|uniref:RING-type domain-containing protein n=1 Tax=Mycena venus TaxID=2733690 RepID=A0A8H6YQA0_9AGAR|nr:RING-type domain-containing protein [Mycena venus]